MLRIVIAGTGYVGLVTGLCLADKGHNVVCVDENENKIKLMQSGVSPIFELGLEELMKKNKDNIKYATDYESAYKCADVIFIAVGTPEKATGSADLDNVFQVAKQIAWSLEKDCIIAVKSTVPMGTNDKVEKIIKDNLARKINIDVVSNPEFLAQGTAVNDMLNASRIVIGVENERAEKIMRKVYAGFYAPVVITNRRSAEMIKYASNDFLALKISYVNEIANLCEIVGANIEDVVEGMGYDGRIGKKFLSAGIGYGGSCFPKDTKALHWLANFHDYELKTIKAAIEVNENQKIKLIKKAKKYFNSLDGLTAAVLGLTFKPGTDDLREAPSLVNIPILLEEGMKIRAWDPAGINKFKKIYPNEITYCTTIDAAINKADICFILTEWDEVKSYDIIKYKTLMQTPYVFDGRNCYKLDDMKKAGVIYESIGRRHLAEVIRLDFHHHPKEHDQNNIQEQSNGIFG
jgi:UDPglucose 6-dehydrogenase